MFESKFALSGIWTHVRSIDPPITSRVWSPLHHQDNHADNTAIEEVIHVLRAWASRETFPSRWQRRGAYNSTWNPTKHQVNDARP